MFFRFIVSLILVRFSERVPTQLWAMVAHGAPFIDWSSNTLDMRFSQKVNVEFYLMLVFSCIKEGISVNARFLVKKIQLLFKFIVSLILLRFDERIPTQLRILSAHVALFISRSWLSFCSNLELLLIWWFLSFNSPQLLPNRFSNDILKKKF